jgi:serine protease AprX
MTNTTGQNDKLPLLLTLFIAIFLFFQSQELNAQDWYAVYLKDKSVSQFDISKPEDFLTQRALLRRQKNDISIDSLDLPVASSYIQQIQVFAKVKYSSRWQNSVLIRLDTLSNLQKISSLPFVDSTAFLGRIKGGGKSRKTHARRSNSSQHNWETDSLIPYGATSAQLNLINLPPLHQAGFLGSNVLISIQDAGFRKADQMQAFQHLYDRNAILQGRDIVNPGNNIFAENSHGTQVLGTIAGVILNTYVGAAPKADFILLRTEDAGTEYPVEEYYWLVGAEYSDSLGCDIISSSLSYTTFDDTTLNHSHAMLDGQSTIISQAANTAFRKGILVLTSAGNDGDKEWRKIGFPADADGVITVGATDSIGNYGTLSSQGYTLDQRVKPDLAAVGVSTSLLSTSDKVFYGNGTSFSTPTISGAIACLISAHPAKTHLEIRQAVLQSARQYNQPDSLMGFGIPDLNIAHLLLRGLDADSQAIVMANVLPNPFSRGFYLVVSPKDTQDIDVYIYDLSGKEVFRNGFAQVKDTQVFYINELANLSNGIYVVKVVAQGESYTRKIVKQQ